MKPQKTRAVRLTPLYALSTVRSRLPRQIVWAILIGLISFGLAVLVKPLSTIKPLMAAGGVYLC
jgi:hypothetical protein